MYNASIDVVDFSVTRAAELRALREAVAAISGNRRVFQQLSWHARRRTMSHSARRMPVRLRAAHERRLAKQSGGGKKKEKKSGVEGKMRMKKYRKKVGFLEAMRKLKGAKKGWLETHVWHAKRFRMEDMGAYKVAAKCNDRGGRSCFKAVKNASIVHDASYLQMLEVSARDMSWLKQALRAVMTWEDGRRVMTDPAVGGRRCVRGVVLYGGDGRAIGEVDMLWSKAAPRLWMWMRPEIVPEAEKLLRKDDKVEVVRAERPPLCFRVLGPRAGIVLAAVLDTSGKVDNVKYIGGVRSPGCLPEGCVYVGSVGDPRARFPPKVMGKCAKEVREFGDEITHVFRDVRESELWDKERREFWYNRVKEAWKENEAEAADIPYWLLQRRGYDGFGAGWDLIIPAGWGMAFWCSLMYCNGNRAAGQEEMRMIHLEANLPIFPEDFLDCAAGYSALRREEETLRELYSRRPKSKRVNYDLYRFQSPMFPDLTRIAKKETVQLKKESDKAPLAKRPRAMVSNEGEGDVADDDIRIVRGGRELLRHLGHATHAVLQAPVRGRKGHANNVGEDQIVEKSYVYFVRVRIVAYGRGLPMKNAVLYMPNAEDLKEMRRGAYEGFRESLSTGGDVQASREEIGYVVYGGFSLREGEGTGVGVVAVGGLRRVVEEGRRAGRKEGGALLLFRTISSLHYRAAVARLLP